MSKESDNTQEVERLLEKRNKINDAIDKQIQELNTKDLNDAK